MGVAWLMAPAAVLYLTYISVMITKKLERPRASEIRFRPEINSE